MELKGSREIAADRQTVWAALNDPETLKASIPGCQELTGTPDEGFDAIVKQKVGPVSATFKGGVVLQNVVAGESYTITGEGKGGAAGFAKGGADVRLEDREGGTLLSYDVKANVGGKLAQLGSRIIDGFAKKMADQFFDNFKKAVEGPSAEAAAATPAAQEPASASAGGAEGRGVGEAASAPAGAGAQGVAPAPTSDRDAGEATRAAQPAFQTAVEPPAGGGSVFAKIGAWFRSLFGSR